MLFQKSLQVAAGQRARLRCESRGGNPAPLIKWFIDDQELLGRLLSFIFSVIVYLFIFYFVKYTYFV